MSELADDLAAFAPRPRGRIRLHGQEYAVWAFLDLPVHEAMEVLRAEYESRTPADRDRAGLLQVARVVPDLQPEARQRLTPRQVRRIIAVASEPPGQTPAPDLKLGLWFAQLSRYFHLPWSMIRTMTLRQVTRYLETGTMLRARERLEESMVAAFPHVESKSRETMRHQWLSAAGYSAAPEAQAQRVPWSQLRTFLGAKAKGHA